MRFNQEPAGGIYFLNEVSNHLVTFCRSWCSGGQLLDSDGQCQPYRVIKKSCCMCLQLFRYGSCGGSFSVLIKKQLVPTKTFLYFFINVSKWSRYWLKLKYFNLVNFSHQRLAKSTFKTIRSTGSMSTITMSKNMQETELIPMKLTYESEQQSLQKSFYVCQLTIFLPCIVKGISGCCCC